MSEQKKDEKQQKKQKHVKKLIHKKKKTIKRKESVEGVGLLVTKERYWCDELARTQKGELGNTESGVNLGCGKVRTHHKMSGPREESDQMQKKTV